MQFIKTLFCAFALTGSGIAIAADLHGRATVGGFAAKERFANAAQGDATNDAATLSARAFVDVSNISPERFRIVADVRDKNDFFDKVDKERLTLTPANSVELRQLFFAAPNQDGKVYGLLGRFSAFDSGIVYVDGAELGLRLTDSIRVGGFGGMSPKYDYSGSFDQAGTGSVAGGYGIFESAGGKFYDYSLISAAIVNQLSDAVPATSDGVAAGATTDDVTYERTFLYNNSVFQLSADTRILARIYYDIKPSPLLQDVWISYFRRPSPKVALTLSAMQIEAVEYRKSQDVRDELDASAYKQVRAEVSYRVTPVTSIIGNGLYGQRTVDGFKRNEISFGYVASNLVTSSYSGSIIGGAREKFVANDKFVRIGLGRYGHILETNVDYEYAVERNSDTGENLHPNRLELGVGAILSSRLFGTLAFQRVQDENVEILSGIFRISTRFGNKEIPPVRDGAPMRGNL
jgi:hypothetical protein